MTSPAALAPLDVLLVSLGSTQGLRIADEQLLASLQRAGARAELVAAGPVRPVRTLALTDLLWARSARRAAAARLARGPVRAILYCTTTAALLWPRPGAVRFDAPAAGNRPGRHGVWQRSLERRRLARATLLVPWSEGGLSETGLGASGPPALVVAVAVDPSGPLGGRRDIAAVSYVANPHKKGLDAVLAAWARARREGEELVLAGASPAVAAAGVRVAGRLPPAEFRALLRRSRVFVCAPRREDYGLAQLEALADGCRLVTTPAPGPYAALALARTLDERLVGDDLAAPLRIALDAPADGATPGTGYAARARELLAPWSSREVDRRVAEQLLPALLGDGERARGAPARR